MAAALLLSVSAGCGKSSEVLESSATHAKSTMKPLHHKFGVVKTNSRLTHAFEIRNDSSETWKLAEVRTACKCTLLEPEKTSLSPGEKGSFTVQYDTSAKSGDQSKSIFVTFDSEKAPKFMLTVTAKIRKDLFVSVNDLRFGEIFTGAQTETDFVGGCPIDC